MSKLLFLPLAFIMMMCQNNATQDMEYESLALMDPPPPPRSASNIKVSQEKAMIKRELHYQVDSRDLEEDRQKLDSLLQDFTTELVTENHVRQSHHHIYFVKLKLKSSELDLFSRSVESQFDIVEKSLNAEDVTEEFIDLQSRRETKERYLQRYRELLDEASSVEEILKIEEEIRQLQEEIESAVGRMEYLKDHVQMSRVSLSFTQDIIHNEADARGFGFRVKRSMVQGWELLNDLFFTALSIWPLLILIPLLFLGFRKLRKNRRETTHHP